MLSNLSVKHLRAFTALAAHRNFTRAAKDCNLSQSALSALIHMLEERAGCQLFVRTTRQVRLSVEGERFEGAARKLLADFEATFEDLQDHVRCRKGKVAIAALPSLAGGTLPTLLAAFRQKYPAIALALHDRDADGCIELLKRRQVDFALAPAPFDDPDLQCEQLLTDSCHVVCPVDHALATKQQIGMADLLKPPFIQLSRTSSVRQYLDAVLHPNKVNGILEVQYLSTVAGLVGAGLGISVVPELALGQFMGNRLVARPLKIPTILREICIIRLRDSCDSSSARAMIDCLHAHYSAPTFTDDYPHPRMC